jgi:hypothetical protein
VRFQGFAWLSCNWHFYQVGDLSSRVTQEGMFKMRKLILAALMTAVPLTTAAACDGYGYGYGYNTSAYVAPRARAYGYAPSYGYYGSRAYYGGRTYGYYGYGARGVVRRAAWRRWR